MICRRFFEKDVPRRAFRRCMEVADFPATDLDKTSPSPEGRFEGYFSKRSTVLIVLARGLKFLRRAVENVAEWARWSWSLWGCVCPTERPA